MPSKEEWEALSNFAGGFDVVGKRLKAKDGWNDYEGKPSNGVDKFGFAALPGGRTDTEKGFVNAGTNSNWWSSTEDNDNENNAWEYWIGNKADKMYKFNRDKSIMISVRYVKD